MVERGTENPGVPSSILGPATTLLSVSGLINRGMSVDIRVSSLKNLPVFEEKKHLFLGYIRAILLNDEKTSVAYLIIRKRSFRPYKILRFDRLTGLANDHAVAEGGASRWLMFDRKTNRVVKTARGAPHPCVIEEGEVIGKAVDYLFDETGRVSALVVEKRLLGKEQRVTVDRIEAFKDNSYCVSAGTGRNWQQNPLFDEIAIRTARQLAFATNKTKELFGKAKKKLDQMDGTS